MNSTMPISLQTYIDCLALFQHALGALFQTDELLSISKEADLGSSQGQVDAAGRCVFFDRFCSDIVSMLGTNLEKLSAIDLEDVFRRIYATVSHQFGRAEGGMQLLDANVVQSPFSIQ